MATVFQDQVGGGFGGAGSAFASGGYGVPFGIPMGGFGGGFGGGDGLGLIALLALLGGRGFGRDHDHCKDGGNGDGNAATIAALSALISNRNEGGLDCAGITALMAKMASIEGAIPAASCDLQLALQSAVAGLTGQNTANTNSLANLINQVQLGQLVQSNAIQSAIAGVDTNVDRTGAQIVTAVNADGNQTRALITANRISELESKNIILANEVSELRSDARHNDNRREVEGLRVTIENNNQAIAAQAQLQAQNQQQLQFQQSRFDNERLLSRFNELNLQIARATNSNVIVGNTGAVGTSQTASPTNVNAL